MRTTIKDIAEAAGVSSMAVSAVLNGAGTNVKVSPAKQELIRKIAEELRYQPNHLAQSLKNRKTGMVAVVFQHFDRLGEEQPYYPQLLNGVMSELFPANYTLGLCPKLNVGDSTGTIADGRFDGVLWCRPDFTEHVIDNIQNSPIPVVLMHAPPGTVPGLPTFCGDNELAMSEVVTHLSQLGHKKVAFVADPVNSHTVEGVVRRDAFLSAAFRAGMNAESLVWEPPYQDLRTYRGGNGPHTALVCFSDTLAGGILAEALRQGVKVPQDLSVTGFDSSSFCDSTFPALTSVNQPVEKMAKAATAHLLQLIREERVNDSRSPVVSSIYQCSLDVRGSTGPVPPHRRGSHE